MNLLSYLRKAPLTDSPASKVPFEVLRQIFLNVAELIQPDERTFTDNAKCFSLVCRRWKLPAQSLFYSSGKVTNFKSWDHLIAVCSSNPDLAEFVRSLKIEMSELDSHRTWTARELSTLLQNMPSLTSFHLDLSGSGGPGYKGDWRALVSLPNLQHLSLSSDEIDSKAMPFRHFLRNTPKISSLKLTCTSRPFQLHSNDRVGGGWNIRIDLPALSSLSLSGEQFTRSFEKYQLLTSRTNEGIRSLTLEDGGRSILERLKPAPHVSVKTFLNQVGGNITTLALPDLVAGVLTLNEILSLCPNLEVLTGPHLALLTNPPPLRLRFRVLDLKGLPLDPKDLNTLAPVAFSQMTELRTLKMYTARQETFWPSEDVESWIAKGKTLVVNGRRVHLGGVQTLPPTLSPSQVSSRSTPDHLATHICKHKIHWALMLSSLLLFMMGYCSVVVPAMMFVIAQFLLSGSRR